MNQKKNIAVRQLGAVSWPGLIVFVAVLFLALWLFQRHQLNRAYGPVIVAQSLSVLMTGRMQVEAVVMNNGALPRNAEEAGFTPTDQPYGPPDRVVRLRLDMLDNGELKLTYNGWKFHDATLRLVPSIENDELKWKCLPAGIPSEWIKDWCFQIEERSTKLGAGLTPEQMAADEAARKGSADAAAATPEMPQGPPAWEPPFRSRGVVSGDAAVVAEGLLELATFQTDAQAYFNAHDGLPTVSGEEYQTRYRPEQLELKIGQHVAHVSFGPGASIILQFDGFSEPLALDVSPGISSYTKRLEWTCRISGESTVAVPQECKSP